jgi:hypothetical protein
MYGIDHATRALLRVWNLEDAKANDRHDDSVVQGHGSHGFVLQVWTV